MSIPMDFRREIELAMHDEDGAFAALVALLERVRSFLTDGGRPEEAGEPARVQAR